MKSLSYFKGLLLVIVMMVPFSIKAIPAPPVPLEPIYFTPPVVKATDELRKSSCVELDNAVRYLQPYRYSYKPSFHEDGFNTIAVAAMTIDNILTLNGLLGFVYMGYSSLVDEKEKRRLLEVEQQISLFQQLKAEKHCFE